MNWQVFFTRLGSAIIFAALMMFGLLYSHPMAILGLALLIQFLCIEEGFKLIGKITKNLLTPSWLKYLFHTFGVLIVLAFTIPSIYFILPVIAFPIVLFLITFLQKNGTIMPFLTGIGLMVYIAIPMGCLVSLRGLHFVLPLALILMIWMNDTMAYIVGSFIGKTPFSKISPKKTWEGTIGGALLTVAGAAIWAIYSPFEMYQISDWVGLSVIVILIATAGDLLESKLKRIAEVKDSGRIMPGHGGALDRFDSLLACLPIAFVYIMIFMIEA